MGITGNGWKKVKGRIDRLYKAKGKDEFLKIISPLFYSSRQEDEDWNDLPFCID